MVHDDQFLQGIRLARKSPYPKFGIATGAYIHRMNVHSWCRKVAKMPSTCKQFRTKRKTSAHAPIRCRQKKREFHPPVEVANTYHHHVPGRLDEGAAA